MSVDVSMAAMIGIAGFFGLCALAVVRAEGERTAFGDLIGFGCVSAIVYGLVSQVISNERREAVSDVFSGVMTSAREVLSGAGIDVGALDAHTVSLWLFVSAAGLGIGAVLALVTPVRAVAKRWPLAGVVGANVVFAIMGPQSLGHAVGW